MSSLSSIKGSLYQNYLLVSRNGTNYRKENRGKYVSLLPDDIKYDDLFLVSRNDVKYKIKWMDLYGIVPGSWQTTQNNTISGTTNTVVKDVFYKPDKFSFSSYGFVGTSEDFYVCHDGAYVYTSINNGATWTKQQSSFHTYSGTWNQLYTDPLLSGGYVFLVGTKGTIKFNDVYLDAIYKYPTDGEWYEEYSYEDKYFCKTWNNCSSTGAAYDQSILQIVGNGNRDYMYGAERGMVGFSTYGDHTRTNTTFTTLTLYASFDPINNVGTPPPDMAVGYDYDDNYWLVGTSNSTYYQGRIAYAQDPGNHIMPLSTNDWTDVSLSMDNVTHIACGNGVWVAVGNDSGTIKIETSSSSSPSTWTNVTLPPSMSSSTGAGVFKFDHYAKRFFLGFKDSRKFFHSHDGVNWTENSPTAGTASNGIFGCTWVPTKSYSAVVGDFLVVGAGRQGHRTTITNDVKRLQDSDYMVMDRKEMYLNSKYSTYKFDGALWKSFVETDDTTY